MFQYQWSPDTDKTLLDRVHEDQLDVRTMTLRLMYGMCARRAAMTLATTVADLLATEVGSRLAGKDSTKADGSASSRRRKVLYRAAANSLSFGVELVLGVAFVPMTYLSANVAPRLITEFVTPSVGAALTKLDRFVPSLFIPYGTEAFLTQTGRWETLLLDWQFPSIAVSLARLFLRSRRLRKRQAESTQKKETPATTASTSATARNNSPTASPRKPKYNIVRSLILLALQVPIHYISATYAIRLPISTAETRAIVGVMGVNALLTLYLEACTQPIV
jgi:hypothetical protein